MSDDQKISILTQDMAVVKSQVSDIRDSQRAMNHKLDNMSSYTRQETDDKFAQAQELANLRWLVYAITGGMITFFFYIIQAKVI